MGAILWELSTEQLQAIQITASVFGGGLVSVILRVIDKYRSKQKIQDDHATDIAIASAKNVESAQKINEMLQELLEKERQHSEEVLRVAVDQAVKEAKDECAKRMDELQQQITDLQRKLKRNQNTATRKKKQTTTSKSTTQYQ